MSETPKLNAGRPPFRGFSAGDVSDLALGRQSVFRFANFTFDARSGDLEQNGLRIRLSKQTADILAILIARPGELVTRDELRDSLWPDVQVANADGVINNGISRLRYALKDDPGQPVYIERVPKRGYRFVAQVVEEARPRDAEAERVRDTAGELLAGEALTVGPAPNQPPVPSVGSTGSGFLRGVLIVALAMALVTLAWLWKKHGRAGHSPQTTGSLRLGIAPFEANSPEANEIAASFRMDLEDSLAQTPKLQVVAGHSLEHLAFRGGNLPGETAPLGLNNILFGRVTLHQDALTMRFELVRASDGTHLASIQASGPLVELASMRDSVQRQIFAKVLPASSGRPANLSDTENIEAYRAYLRGRYHFSRQTNAELELARQNFQAATVQDPGYAKAFAMLGRTYIIMALHGAMDSKIAFVRAAPAVSQALRLRPNLADAHAVNEMMLLFAHWQLDEALKEGQRAVELDGDDPSYRQDLATVLAIRGETREAEREIESAEQLDPYWAPLQVTKIYVATIAKNEAEAMAAVNKLLQLTQHSPFALDEMGNVLWIGKQYPEAIATWRQMAEAEHDPDRIALEDRGLTAFRTGGPAAYARVRIEGMKQPALVQRHEQDFILAEWSAYANDTETARQEMERLCRDKDPQFLELIPTPVFDAIRNAPELVRAMETAGLRMRDAH